MAQAEGKWVNKHGSRARVVEVHLAELQNAHRLAMHRFEEDDDQRIFPTDTQAHLTANSKAPLPELLAADKASLLSMTLLPTQQTGISFPPYCVSFLSNVAGYLVDMSADSSDPALAVKVFRESMNTGKDPTNKDFKMDESSGVDSLDELYKNQDKRSLMRAVAQNPHLSARQMDALGESYGTKKDPDVQEINEILVAAKPKHLAGIFVPVDEFPDTKYTAPLFRTMACLSGLEHLNQGMDLPVVEYHIYPPHQGKFTYLAQGKDELEDVARKSIVQLQKDGEFDKILQKCKNANGGELCSPFDEERHAYKLVSAMHDDVMRLLGVDIYQPLKLKADRIKK